MNGCKSQSKTPGIALQLLKIIYENPDISGRDLVKYKLNRQGHHKEGLEKFGYIFMSKQGTKHPERLYRITNKGINYLKEKGVI